MVVAVRPRTNPDPAPDPMPGPVAGQNQPQQQPQQPNMGQAVQPQPVQPANPLGGLPQAIKNAAQQAAGGLARMAMPIVLP